MKYMVRTKAGEGKVNEDASRVARISDDTMLAVVCDGMGGLECGDIAASTAANTIAGMADNGNAVDPASLIQRAVKAADKAIETESVRIGAKMGCAVAVTVLSFGRLYWATLGNVRVSLTLRNGETLLLSKDDVYTDKSGGTFLTRSLRGRGLTEDPIVQSRDIEPGSIVAVSTDGYYLNDPTDDSTLVEMFV